MVILWGFVLLICYFRTYKLLYQKLGINLYLFYFKYKNCIIEIKLIFFVIKRKNIINIIIIYINFIRFYETGFLVLVSV